MFLMPIFSEIDDEVFEISFCLEVFLGFVLTKSQAISWFRIQEMFRFQSFHMFGLFFTAIPAGMISVFLIRRFQLKDFDRRKNQHPEKRIRPRIHSSAESYLQSAGRLPELARARLYAQIGSGVSVGVVTLLCALACTWVYSYLRPKLPH